jgi:hypothetical protein
VILSQEKFNKSWCWPGFGSLEVLWQKRVKLYQLLPLYNFASFKTSPTVKQDIYEVIHLISPKKLNPFCEL